MTLNKTVYPAIKFIIIIHIFDIATIPCQALLFCDVSPSTFNSTGDVF